MTKKEEKKIELSFVTKLLKVKPELKEFVVSNGGFRISSEKEILEIADTDENKQLYYDWQNARKNRLNKSNDDSKSNNDSSEKKKQKRSSIPKNIQEINANDEVIHLKKVRDNLNTKLNNEIKEKEQLQEMYENVKLQLDELIKEHHKVCTERNRLELLTESKGWSKDKLQEFSKMKIFYQKCQCSAKDIMNN